MIHLDEIRKHEFIVMCYEHYTPLGIIRSLGEVGIHPIVIILKNKWSKVASASKYISRIHYVKDVEEGLGLLISQYGGRSVVKPFVIPCDDQFAEICDNNYDRLKDKFYIQNAKEEQGRIVFFQNKNNINEMAQKHGLNVAKTYKVKRGKIPEDIEYPIITKTISSNEGGWKTDYHICQNEMELREAYKVIKADHLLLQKFIVKKTELCLDGVIVNHGRQWICIASRYPYAIPEGYSAKMNISNLYQEKHYEKIKKSLDSMFEDIGFEGIFSLEFMVDEEDNLWFLEENFRSSTWTYAGTALGMNFVILWAEGCLYGEFPENAEVDVPTGYKAMAEFPDFKQRVLKHRITLKDWIKEVRSCDCLFFYNRKDKMPAFTSLLYKGMNAIRVKFVC
ncbi:biotin carboxylase [Lachnospiraceae bacterium 48-21]